MEVRAHEDVTWTGAGAVTGVEADAALEATMARFVPMDARPPRRIHAPYPAREFLTARPIDDVIFVGLSWGPRRLTRRPDDMPPPGEEYVALIAVHSGGEVIDCGADQHSFKAGDLALWTCDRPTRVEVPAFINKSLVLIPGRVLESVIPRKGLQSTFQPLNNAPTADLMLHLLDYLVQLPDAARAAHRQVRNALVHLAIGTVGTASHAQRSVVKALHQSVIEWIDDHLFDPDLSGKRIAQAHAVSSRTLHRAFQGQQRPLAEEVRIRKLERARDFLARGDHSVTWVSEKLNFANPSHFSRSFSQQFGVTPSDYRSTAVHC